MPHLLDFNGIVKRKSGDERYMQALNASDVPAMIRDVVSIEPFGLAGNLQWPEGANSIVVFAHGSGSSRLSPRNTKVANALNASGMATLLFDLLSREEEADRANVFDIPLLGERLLAAVDWLDREKGTGRLHLGLFGASTGAAAALMAAAGLGRRVEAVVSRGGRPDLAMEALPRVEAATLLLVGGADAEVIALNEMAFERLRGPKSLSIVPGAGHLFSEPGALEEVIDRAASWFECYLSGKRRGEAP
jgi:putative phosphoribosyl transferase